MTGSYFTRNRKEFGNLSTAVQTLRNLVKRQRIIAVRLMKMKKEKEKRRQNIVMKEK